MSDEAFYSFPKASKSIHNVPKVLLDVYVANRNQNNLVVIPVVSKQSVQNRSLTIKDEDSIGVVSFCLSGLVRESLRA